MSDEPADNLNTSADRPRRRLSGCLVGCAVMIPIGYALSPLPYFCLLLHLANVEVPVDWMIELGSYLYWPLWRLADRVEPVQQFYDWYLGLIEVFVP